MAVSPYSDLPLVCSVTTNFLAQNINYVVNEDNAAIGIHKPPMESARMYQCESKPTKMGIGKFPV